jgi:hypothetical protein
VDARPVAADVAEELRPVVDERAGALAERHPRLILVDPRDATDGRAIAHTNISAHSAALSIDAQQPPTIAATSSLTLL